MLFVLSFVDEAQRVNKKMIINKKNINAMIDRQNFFDQPVKHELMTYDSIHLQ